MLKHIAGYSASETKILDDLSMRRLLIIGEMTFDQIAEALRLVREWQPAQQKSHRMDVAQLCDSFLLIKSDRNRFSCLPPSSPNDRVKEFCFGIGGQTVLIGGKLQPLYGVRFYSDGCTISLKSGMVYSSCKNGECPMEKN